MDTNELSKYKINKNKLKYKYIYILKLFNKLYILILIKKKLDDILFRLIYLDFGGINLKKKKIYNT